MDKIRIIHIIKDDKFYNYIDGFIKSGQYDCIRVLITDKPDYQISWIPNNTDIITLYRKSDIIDFFRRGDYDAIFLQSLTRENKKYIRYIPQDKYVIWWSYGYELYTHLNGLKPLIPLDVYKPFTKKLYTKTKKGFIKEGIKQILGRIYYNHRRNKLLERIDFFQPVIPLEFNLMLNNSSFHAKEFYYPNSYNRKFYVNENINGYGDIMIGNSCTYTNNHIDIIHQIKRFLPKDRNIIFPLSYGDIKPQQLIKNFDLKDCNVKYLTDFVPAEEYFQIVNNCSYFISGVIRQQSMGNISYCLSIGIKVFLFKDSIIYKYLKEAGFVVYAIEDINEESFNAPLTKEEQVQNCIAARNRSNRQNSISDTTINIMKSHKRNE